MTAEEIAEDEMSEWQPQSIADPTRVTIKCNDSIEYGPTVTLDEAAKASREADTMTAEDRARWIMKGYRGDTTLDPLKLDCIEADTANQFREAITQARAEMREEAIAAAEAEDELPGPMPPEMLLVPLEDALRGAVRVTKRNIIAAIRALEVS